MAPCNASPATALLIPSRRRRPAYEPARSSRSPAPHCHCPRGHLHCLAPHADRPPHAYRLHGVHVRGPAALRDRLRAAPGLRPRRPEGPTGPLIRPAPARVGPDAHGRSEAGHVGLAARGGGPRAPHGGLRDLPPRVRELGDRVVLRDGALAAELRARRILSTDPCTGTAA